MSDIDVLMGFDANYAMPASVAIRSLGLSLEPNESARIHILGVGLTADHKRRISESAADLVELIWYDFDVEQVSGLPLSWMSDERYITSTTYAFLFFDQYLPPEVERVIVLDADTLVRRSPAQLAVMDLHGCTLAAVRDFGCCTISMTGGVAAWRDLGLDGRSAAFNGGILVIDRDEWRSREIRRRSIDYLTAFPGSINYVDQDCLNATNAGNWLELDPTWNYQTHIEWDLGGDAAMAYAFIERDLMDRARRDPAIAHYAGTIKPWHEQGDNLPFVHEWRALLNDTGWRGTPLVVEPKNPLSRVIRYRIRKAYHSLIGR